MVRKILYSPGFGAGWTTWVHDPEVKLLMLTYAPIVDAIERDEWVSESHPAVRQLIADVEALGKDAPYLGGLRDLCVRTVTSRVRIEEYDGSESVIEETDPQDWM